MYFVERRSSIAQGQHIVYESRDEAERMGVAPEDIIKAPKEIKRVGQWFEYPNGVIAEVQRIYVNHSSRTILTPINAFDDRAVNPDCRYRVFAFAAKDLDLEEVDRQKMNFVHDWLFKGYGIADAVRRNLLREYRTYTLNRHTKPGQLSLLRFGYWILNYEWFDKLLEQSRPIRDRYMSLTKAFENEGISDEYLARRLKKNIESQDGKVSNAALFKAIEILEDNKNRREKSQPQIPDSLKERPAKRVRGEGTNQLPAKTTRDDYLEEIENEMVTIQKLTPADLQKAGVDVQLKTAEQLRDNRRELVINEIQKGIERGEERETEQVSGNGNGQRERDRASSPDRDETVPVESSAETRLSGTGEG